MTTLKNANNPFFFEAIWCRECQSTENLYLHRYNEEVMCKCCVNIMIEREQSQTDESDKNFGCTYADIRLGDIG